MSNRRFKRMQERMMKKPKFVEALRRFNDLPTNEELEAYLNRRVEEAKMTPVELVKPLDLSEERLQEFKEYREQQFDNNIVQQYKTK